MLKIESAVVAVAAALKDEKSAWQPKRPSRLRSRVKPVVNLHQQWFFRTFGEAVHAAPTNGVSST